MSERTAVDGNRGSEATIESTGFSPDASRTLRWGAALIALAGIGTIGNGIAVLYRAFFSNGFEAGVHGLGGHTRAELAETNPAVVSYIDHLHVNVAGLMVALGLVLVVLAWYGIRRGRRWALATAVVAPAVFLAHSLPIHQTAEFSFHALAHLGPGLVWLPTLVVGAVLSYLGLRSSGDQPT